MAATTATALSIARRASGSRYEDWSESLVANSVVVETSSATRRSSPTSHER